MKNYLTHKKKVFILYAISGVFIILDHLLKHTSAINTFDYPLMLNPLQISYGFIFFISGYFSAIEIRKGDSYSSINQTLKTIAYIYPLYLLALSSYALLGFIDKTTFLHAATLLSIFRAPHLPTLWFATFIIFLNLLTPVLHYLQNKKYRTINYALLLLGLIATFTLYKLTFQGLDIRIVLYLPSFIGGFYMAQNRVKILHCLVLLILASVIYLVPLKKGFLEILSTAPLILAIPAVTVALWRTFQDQIDINKTSLTLYRSIFCALLFYRVIFLGIVNLYFPIEETYSLAYLALICLPTILIISRAVQETYSRAYKIILPQTHLNYKTALILTLGITLIILAVHSKASSQSKIPADYKNEIQHEMNAQVNKIISVKVSPDMQYSYALMEKGVLQNTDRRYTYDYIPEIIKGGYLFQGIHRTPRGTSFNFKVHEPLKIFFFFHTRLDGGYGSVFPELTLWKEEKDVPMYDIYNGDHGRSITMYSAEFSPGIYTLPETTEKDACIGFVVKHLSKQD